MKIREDHIREEKRIEEVIRDKNSRDEKNEKR